MDKIFKQDLDISKWPRATTLVISRAIYETKSPFEKEVIYRLVTELDDSFLIFMLLDLRQTSRKVTYSSLDLLIFHTSLTTLALSNRRV